MTARLPSQIAPALRGGASTRRTAPALRGGASSRPRVLVIYKKSAYQVYVRERRHPRVAALLREGDRAASRLRRAHRSHETTLERAREVLRKLGARAVFRHRSVQSAALPA